MKKKRQNKKKKQNSNHYSEIDSLSYGSTDTESKISRTMKRWNNVLIFLFILLLPTQLGKHFFFDFSYLSGVRVDFLAPVLYLTDILAIVLILLNLKTVLRLFFSKKIVILLSLLFVNVVVSQFNPISTYRYLKIVELLGVFAVFKNTKISPSLVLLAFLAGGIFELFLALAQFISKQSLQGVFYFFGERLLNLSLPGIAKASLNGVEILRPYATFSHPNSLAGFYLLVYFFILNLKEVNSWIKNLLLLICSLLIFVSFSKIAILTFLLLNFIYLWQGPLKKSCRFCFFARIFMLSLVSFIFLQAHSDPLSLQKRFQLMEDSRVIIEEHAFLGTGLGRYLIAQEKLPQPFTDFFNQPVHNIFLLLTSEIGIFTVILLLLLFNKNIWQLFKTYPYIVLVILFTGSFDHYWLTLQQNFMLLGVILGLLL